jgi:hypothetical protein
VTSSSHREERQFGVSVGLVLLAFGAYFFWRGRGPWWYGLPGGVGGVLVFFGLAWPAALVHPNRAWMKFAEVLSFVSIRIILGALFFLVISPLGAWRRLRGWDPLLRRGPRRESYWQPYSERQANPKHYEKSF